MTVTIDELVKELGFCVVPTKEKPFSLDEVRFNLLAYLEDYSKMGFSFVKAGDELVELRKNQESYRLVGQCFLGLFVIGEEEQIFLLCNQEGREVFQEARIYVNSSLQAFVSSYSFWEHMAYLIEDDGIVLRDDLFHILNKEQ